MKNQVYVQGDNLTFLASQIVAPAHVTGDNYTNIVGPVVGATTPVNLVEVGDPCVVGRIVGVANNDALFLADSIVLSTRGVYSLSVVSNYAHGIHVGETLYIHPATAVVSDDASGIPFGCALSAVAGSATATINVKLFGQTPDSNGLQGGLLGS